MVDDRTVAVAQWLSRHQGSHHQFSELGALVDKKAPDRQAQLEAVRAAVLRLDALGLVIFYHHTMPAVATRHRAGLRCIAAGEPLGTVAQAIEPQRPVTLIRISVDRYAAWYRTPLRLPVGATTAGIGGVYGSTPDEALAALRAQAFAACHPGWLPNQTTACQ